jgi:hypothetical protein
MLRWMWYLKFAEGAIKILFSALLAHTVRKAMRKDSVNHKVSKSEQKAVQTTCRT